MNAPAGSFDIAKACFLLAAMAGAGFATALGCEQVLGAHFDDLEHAPAVEGGVPVDGGVPAGSESCVHAGPPPRPPPDSGTKGGSVVFVVAQTATSFGDGAGVDDKAGYATVGFDIDHTCTDLTEGPSCREPVWATDFTDGEGGIDNATGKLSAKLRLAGMEPDGGPQAQTPWRVLARVSQYNGEANDGHVEVEFYWGTRLTNTDGGVPRWDGTDQWDVAALELVSNQGQYSLEGSMLVDPTAYVSGGVIVAHLASFPLVSPGLMPRNAYDIVWAGRLAQGDAGWEIHEGVQSARVPLKEFLGTLSGYPDPQDASAPLCTTSASYWFLKRAICSLADISTRIGDPSAPCDALSNGTTFEGIPARLGGIDTRALAESNCAPDADPYNDTCDNLE